MSQDLRPHPCADRSNILIWTSLTMSLHTQPSHTYLRRSQAWGIATRASQSYLIERMRLLDLLATAFAPSYLFRVTIPRDDDPHLDTMDCQIRCPRSTDPNKVILPALSQKVNASVFAENILECWQVDSVSTSLPGILNAFRIDWEGGFDAAYQYIFTGPSFMPSHPAPEPSLIVMSSGIGMFFRSPSLFISITVVCDSFGEQTLVMLAH